MATDRRMMRQVQSRGNSSFWRISRRKSILGFLLGVGLLAALGVLVFPHYHQRWAKVAGCMEQVTTGKYNQLYGGEYFLKVGMDIDQEQLFVRLHSLGYRLGVPQTESGTYCLESERIVIRPNGGKKSKLYTVHLNNDVVVSIQQTPRSIKVVRSLTLGRPLLTSYRESIWEQREVTSLLEMPEHLINAVTIAEDNSFFTHHGLDFKGIGRAAVVNLKNMAVRQGGSTITQQLIKTFLQRTERTFTEKLFEALMALHLELLYSKQEILEAYLNNVYMGHIGPFSLHGVGGAARLYLGKDIAALQPGESAMLAVMIRSPNILTPNVDNHRNLVRAVNILQEMKQREVLDKEYIFDPFEYTGMGGQAEQEMLLASAWVIDALKGELTQYNSPLLKTTVQQQIEISLDPLMQQKAAFALADQLQHLEQQNKDIPSLQGAVVVVGQQFGGVKALVGGRDYLQSQFSRAVSARRPVGSLIKPFVYMAAMGSDPGISPATVFYDTPMRLTVGKKVWRPHNFDNKYKGPVTLEQALIASRNIPAVRAGLKASVGKVAGMVQAVGISDKPMLYPSLLLGACLSSPLKMAAAYGTIAQEGSYVRPQLVDRVVVGGSVVVLRRAQKEQVLDKWDSKTMTGMLEKVLTDGTGRAARKWGVSGKGFGGKTGTTNNFRDAWFAGFSDDCTAVVWIGNDSNQGIGMTGAKAALPVWAELMQGSNGTSENERRLSSAPQVAVERPAVIKLQSVVGLRKKPLSKGVRPLVTSNVKKEKNASQISDGKSMVSAEYKKKPLKHQRYKYFQ